MNLVNVLVQMIIMNRFLGGEFTTYGWDVLNFTEWDWSVRYDPMVIANNKSKILYSLFIFNLSSIFNQ